MEPDVEPNHHTSLLREYLELWEAYDARGVNELRDPNDKENLAGEDWAHRHYISIGRDALNIIVKALIGAERRPPESILDFPSGSGRVTRHLRAMFPTTRIGACDLYPEHVQFCAKYFDAIPLLSNENLDNLEVGSWDLIFCGSLLTHLPEDLFFSALKFIIRSLSPDGIAVVTLEGRHSLYIQENKWKLIGDELFAVALAGFEGRGFGFVDYEHDFKATKFSKQASYGVALTKPSWLLSYLEADASIRILAITERDWDDHQDVVVFGKPGVNAAHVKEASLPKNAVAKHGSRVEALIVDVCAAKPDTSRNPPASADEGGLKLSGRQ